MFFCECDQVFADDARPTPGPDRARFPRLNVLWTPPARGTLGSGAGSLPNSDPVRRRIGNEPESPVCTALRQWPRPAPKLNETAGCFNAAAMFMEQGSLAEAENWYWRACLARLGQACRALGDIADPRGRGREAGVLNWRGCQSEDAPSCAHLGERYLTGLGGEVDRARGLQFLRRACDRRDSLACKRLAQESR